MDWRKWRRGEYHSRGRDLGYVIVPKKNGKYFVEARQAGGAKHQMPFQDFESPEAAMEWVDAHERELAKTRERMIANSISL